MDKKFIIILLSLVTAFTISSCDNQSTTGPYIDETKLVKTKIDIHRYGKSLFQIDTLDFLNGVSKMQDEFVLFLGTDTNNPAKLQPLYEYVTDTHLISIANKVIEVYPELTDIEIQLGDAFSRYEYFFPDYQIPEVYSYISNLYYEKPVIIDDSVIIIAIDVYLGADFPYYRTLGLPYYIIRRMNSENIAVDVMKEIYNTDLERHYKQKTLIDRMVNSGKLLYYLDAVLPNTPDSIKIGYTSSQINWIDSNKKNVWAYLINNKLFYSPDYKIQSNFLKEAPFTSGFSNNSPPRLGIWMGWQIVRRYMDKHPDVSLQQLINNNDAQEIFNKSGYKP